MRIDLPDVLVGQLLHFSFGRFDFLFGKPGRSFNLDFLLFAGALLNSLSRSIVQVLDEQSTGMLADNLEKRKHV